MQVVYTGERTRIRPFRDLDEWMKVQGALESNFNEFWGDWHWAEAQKKKEFEPGGMLSTDEYSCFAIERLDTGEAVGFEEYGAMNPARTNTWLGTIIAREHWGKGFGREAKLLNLCYLFENYPIECVWSDTTDEHSRAKAGLEACGLKLAGKHYGYLYKGGRLLPSPCYRILRDEWEQLPIRQSVKRGH
ncbi:MAG: GNAT family N-acetyltransferase [Planctomycetales bacterium]|nr:GNAT family N-acetyltransferase [bacterium]UNM09634.1 MAG: GNAT family N-acetyltransferase [Planctomycetales bacterium]